MSLWRLTWKNMWHERSLLLLAMSTVALVTALLVFVQLASDEVEESAKRGYGPYELVIGHEGSPLSLVLHTFYHVGEPLGNVPYEVYEYVARSPWKDVAYPMTRGDSYDGFPLIGTDVNYFKTRYGALAIEGATYEQTGDVVIGSHVARATGLTVGDTFYASHGAADGHAHDEMPFTVTGILPPLGTADDRALWTTLDYAWHVHAEESDEEELTEGPITSIVVVPSGLMELQQLEQMMNERDGVQAVYSGKTASELLSVVDQGRAFVYVVTVVSFVIAGLSIMLALLAVGASRAKDIALLRLLGRSRSFNTRSIVLEGALVTGIGSLVGIVGGHVIAAFASPVIYDRFGIAIDAWTFQPMESLLVIGSIGIGMLVSFVPARRAYRVDPLTLIER